MPVWLYIPRMINRSAASPFAPALADWSLASTSQNPDIGLFVSSSGKPTRQPPSWPGWQTRPWITLLSGTMLPASTADRGAAAFISSLAAIPASRSPSRGKGRARMIRATSGRKFEGSSASVIPNGASSRTSKGTSISALTPSLTTFSQWGSRSKLACSRRSKRARHTTDAASSYWPTPTRSLYCNQVEIELSTEGMKWRNDPRQVGNQIAIGKAARLWTLMYLLIRSCGAVATKPFSYPFSLPLHLTLRPGARYSAGDLSFNPNFSDWLMGWPIGWTAPSQPVTEWSAWLQRMRGELSKLPTLPSD